MYTVYILRTSKNTLYTGITNNVEKRLTEHRSKGVKSSKYMRAFDSFKIVYTETRPDRSHALKREAEIKNLTRNEKDSLISKACISY